MNTKMNHDGEPHETSQYVSGWLRSIPKKIDITQYTAHQHPGKFEGESSATEHFWEQMMNGDGETIYESDYLPERDDDFDYSSGLSADLFHINAEEAEAFELPIGATFMIREDGQGFVYGTCHENREEAEKQFRNWLGL